MTDSLPDGLFRIRSNCTFEVTLKRVMDALTKSGFTIFSNIDHRQFAEAVGLKLKPTTVILFGNPVGGTPLMNMSGTIAIDLPSKILVAEDETGTVVYFSLMSYTAKRHGLNGTQNTIDTFDSRIREMLSNIC